MIASMLPAGIWAKICGNVMYTKPGPSEGDVLKANTAGIMAKPAKRAKEKSATTV